LPLSRRLANVTAFLWKEADMVKNTMLMRCERVNPGYAGKYSHIYPIRFAAAHRFSAHLQGRA